MPKMKDNGVEWLGEIPESWTICKCKYLFSYRKQIVGNEVSTFERLALTLNGVIKRSKDDDNGLQPTDFSTYQILRTNQLVFKLIDLQNVSTSRVGLSSFDGIVSPAYIILEPSKSISPKFAEQYFLMLWHRQIFNQLGDAGVRSSLNAGDLLDVPFVLPPIDTQNNIVNFLDSKKIWIKSLTDNLNNQIDKLKDYKKALITKCVTKGLDPNVSLKDSGTDWIGNVPEKWTIVKGRCLFNQRSTKGNNIVLQLLSPTQKYGVVPQDMYEELSGMAAVKLQDGADLSLLKTIHKGDFCISLRSFQGGFEYSSYEGVVSPAYHVFYPIVEIDDAYYKYMFKSDLFIFKMRSYPLTLRDGKNISFSDFGDTLIPYPPAEEQHKIGLYLDKKCSEIDSLIFSKQQQIDKLNEYQKSLIYEYVTGKKEII